MKFSSAWVRGLLGAATIAASTAHAAECAPGLAAFQNTVHALIRRNCVHCHEGNGGPIQGPPHSVEDPAQSYARVLAYVNFENLDESLFVRKGGNMHCLVSYGVNCNTDEAMIKSALQAWWDGGEKDCPRKGRYFSTTVPLPANTPQARDAWTKLRFPLGNIDASLQGAVFEMEAQRFSPPTGTAAGSYRFRMPRLASPTASLKVRDVKVLVNGKYDPLSNGFSLIDQTVAPAAIPADVQTPLSHPVLSSKSLIVIADRGAGDELTVSFEGLQAAAAPRCDHLDLFRESVKPTFAARRCSICHGGGEADEAGTAPANQRLSMRLSDEALCAMALQRLDSHVLLNAPLIDYPLRGANGHPRIIPQLSEVLPWQEWVEAELGQNVRIQ